MLCNSPKPFLLGIDNLFSQLGFTDCAVRWMELVMVACTVAALLFVAMLAAYQVSRWVEWLYLKFLTRRGIDQVAQTTATEAGTSNAS